MIFLFGEERFKNYIIVDEPPLLLKELSSDVKMGAIYDKQSLTTAVDLLNGNKTDADKYKTSSFILVLGSSNSYLSLLNIDPIARTSVCIV